MSQHLHFSQPDRFSPFRLSDLSPGSPDSITMPSPGQAVDLAMPPFAQYASLPAQSQGQSQNQSQSQSQGPSQAQGLGTAQNMADLQTLNGGHGQQLPFLQNQALMLSQFIVDQGPWNPLSLDPACGDLSKRQPDAAPFARQFANFGDYRNPVVPPSEADTASPSLAGVLSDSGYGSMAKQSVGNRSIYNGDADHSFDTQSLSSHFQRMTHRTALPNEEHRKREVIAQRPASGAPNSKTFQCPDCNAVLKTNSELNKHRARHDKPFKCTVANCAKATEGFSTNNDLDRHKRCVHKLVVGVETFYRCDIDQCRDKLKNWPRQDNFRQHLRRKHRLEHVVDLSRFTFQSPGPVDNAGFPTVVASTEAMMLSSDPASHSGWTAVNHTHVSPASLMNGTGDGHHGLPNMMTYERHAASFNVDASQYMAQDSQVNTRAQLDMEPALSRLGMPPPSQRAGTPISQFLSAVDQPACVAPDMLRHTGTEARTLSLADIRLQTATDPRWWVHAGGRPLPHQPVAKEAPLEIDDASEASEDSDEGAHSDRDEVESGAPDGMDVDDVIQDSMSLVDPQDSDSEDEDNEPLDDAPETHASVEDVDIQDSQEPEAQVKASPPEPQPSVETPQPIDLDDDVRTEAFLRSLMEGGKLMEKLKKLGIPVPDEEEAKDQKPSVDSSAASENGGVDSGPIDSGPIDSGPINNGPINNGPIDNGSVNNGPTNNVPIANGPIDNIPSDNGRANNDNKAVNKCDECSKTFTRRCELKKHQKRHAKPYHCTYANCDKKFGSKNDWKRHENSQHFQLEIWRCAERAADGQLECGKVCHRRESLCLHLRKDHGILHPVALDKKLANYRIGRNFGSRFWCGFCQKTIEPTGRPAPAHGERFDHIDAHFNGKGVPKADIKDWKHVDPNPNEHPDLAMMARAKLEKGNSRKRGHDGDGSGAKAKRRKGEKGTEEYWVCCFCQQYSLVDRLSDPEGLAPACVGGECNHKRCDGCETFESRPEEQDMTAMAVAAEASGQGGAVPTVEKAVEVQGREQEGAKEKVVIVVD